MKKRVIYSILLLLFLSATAFIVFREGGGLQNKVNAFYPLKERKGLLAQAPEWASVKERGEKLIRVVRETPDDKKSALALATIYVQEGRATGEAVYYDEAALHYIESVLTAEPENFEALMLKSLVQLSQHHFAEGLLTAQKATSINPHNAYVYGLMTDAHVEMGNYDEAVKSLDKMVSIRPDLRSYSRIAYLREIHGDLSGAVEAMKEAVKAGFPGEEGTAWARIQLAQLYEAVGDLKAAEMHYSIAQQERPGYAYAVAGLGNIAVARQDYQKAIALYGQADAILNDYGFREKLAETFLLIGEKEKADNVLDGIIAQLTAAANAGEGSAGHHVDKELAFVYTLKGNGAKAVEHALNEYKRRPKNIDVAETLAWAHYNAGDAQKALTYLNVALKTGSRMPSLLCRAGLIYRAAGDKAKAKQFLEEGLKANPAIGPLLLGESRSVLKTL